MICPRSLRFFFHYRGAHRDLHSFPTRRSSDLKGYGDKLLFEDLSFSLPPGGIVGIIGPNGAGKTTLFKLIRGDEEPDAGDRKSTRLNSSHSQISYAVFCLKKKREGCDRIFSKA